MTKKDYILIAQALNNVKPFESNKDSQTYHDWERVVIEMMHVLQEDNPLFDRVKFTNACKK